MESPCQNHGLAAQPAPLVSHIEQETSARALGEEDPAPEKPEKEVSSPGRFSIAEWLEGLISHAPIYVGLTLGVLVSALLVSAYFGSPQLRRSVSGIIPVAGAAPNYSNKISKSPVRGIVQGLNSAGGRMGGDAMASGPPGGTTQVTLKVHPDVAREIHEGLATLPGTRDLTKASAELGVALRALHPGATDPLLAPYFYVDAAGPEKAIRVRDRFLRCGAVEGSYIKPPDAPP